MFPRILHLFTCTSVELMVAQYAVYVTVHDVQCFWERGTRYGVQGRCAIFKTFFDPLGGILRCRSEFPHAKFCEIQ
jgi:hypothetical protein